MRPAISLLVASAFRRINSDKFEVVSLGKTLAAVERRRRASVMLVRDDQHANFRAVRIEAGNARLAALCDGDRRSQHKRIRDARIPRKGVAHRNGSPARTDERHLRHWKALPQCLDNRLCVTERVPAKTEA